MEAKTERTTIQVSITVEDKTALKIMAAERGMTVAALIHEWVEREKGEAKQ